MKKRWMSLLLVLALILSVCPVALAMGEETNVGELRRVYGEEDLADEDAMVLLIMGDGFAAEDQEKFYEKAAETAEYIMECPPYDEFYDVVKIYALGVVSAESGVTGAGASSPDEVKDYQVDTYFEASYYTSGMQRLVSLSERGAERGYALQEKYLPETDYVLYIVNSDIYGGSGGDYCVASLNKMSYDMMVHEMGHTIGNLSDEYYASGYEGEYANLTADPDNVPWARFIGKNGIGVYPWAENPDSGYYMPALNCKMRYLSNGTTTYDFCEVCQEQLRKSICANANVPKIFLQTYADTITPGTDMSEYLIYRKGETEKTVNEFGSGYYYLCYYDEDGNFLGYDDPPTTPGTYGVTAYIYYAYYDYDLPGYVDVESDYFEYEVEAETYSITLNVSSKTYDGAPADVTYSVERLDESLPAVEDLTMSLDYVVTPFHNSSVTYYYVDLFDGTWEVYTSEDEYAEPLYTVDTAPSMAGTYEVIATAWTYDYEIEDWIDWADASATYTISLASNKLVDNNDDEYWGAYSYGNNKNILIYGEGFTAEEQDEFNRLAAELTENILAQEPYKELQLYFNVLSVNTESAESGIASTDGAAKDTFFKLRYDPATGGIPKNGWYEGVGEDAVWHSWYHATLLATNMCYSFAATNDDAACIIIVNDEHVKECSIYAPYVTGSDRYNPSYHYFQTIFVSPYAEDWSEYAAAEVLNYLTNQVEGYRAETASEKEDLRLDLLSAMYCAYGDEFAPVIASRAYDETFVFDGKPVDLEPYFHVYYGAEEIYGVNLALTYYADDNGEPGEALSGAPSWPGTYHVKAETVPDPDDPEEYYQTYVTEDGETLKIGLSRGWTTFTIEWPAYTPGSGSSSSGSYGSGSASKPVEAVSAGFADVPTAAYYADAVEWAVEQGVTTGTGTYAFSPEKSCTRAEAVTFLWRAMGEPEPETAANPFTDVPESAYYYKAVLWAVEQGITKGTSDTTFSPDDACTRAQIVTFLWRLDGCEEVQAANPFTDVADDAYYAAPVLWAMEEGVTSGTSATAFSPDALCTRSQIVTFLYRYLGE